MTLTKYQRGDPMEGWNDCPSVMLPTPTSSTRGNRRRVKRVGHDINNSNGIVAESGNRPGTNVLSLPNGLPAPPYSKSLNGSWVMVSKEDGDPKKDKEQGLHKLFSLPTNLTGEVYDLYKSKLSQSSTTFTTEDSEFFLSIVDQVMKYSSITDEEELTCTIEKTKTQILSYMMVKTDASSWCVPLRKLSENVKI